MVETNALPEYLAMEIILSWWSDLYPWLVGAIGGFFGAIVALPTRFAEMAFKNRLDRLLNESKTEQAHLLERFSALLLPVFGSVPISNGHGWLRR
jgi:hypothetical protein